MFDFTRYSDYLYLYTRIPVYCYQDGSLVHACPEQHEMCRPPKKYLDALFCNPDNVFLTQTKQDAYWGMLRLGEGRSLVLGPVHPFGFDELLIPSMYQEYGISQNEREAFSLFFQSIPPTRMMSLVFLLATMNYSLNHQPFPPEIRSRLKDYENTIWSGIHYTRSDTVYDLKENDGLYDNSLVEAELCSCIENGNLERLNALGEHLYRRAHFGETAVSSLRQVKNMFIIADTLVSRAAIRGGLPATVAYSISDIYIKQMEMLQSAADVRSLTHMMQEDFCRRVAELEGNVLTSDDILMKAINYVHKHTNENLKTEDVARAIGFSRTYLSKKFKQELGFGLSDFIRRCKLEESRSLLLYSDKPISEISSYLGFSTQAHFQTIFKKQFGMTPLECRNKKGHFPK